MKTSIFFTQITSFKGHVSIGDSALTSSQKGSYLYINSHIIEESRNKARIIMFVAE